MDYLKVRCFRCGGSFELYNHTMNSQDAAPRCPHCLTVMDQGQWERLTDAFLTFAEVNKNFRKRYEDRGEPLFQAELRTHYVPANKIKAD